MTGNVQGAADPVLEVDGLSVSFAAPTGRVQVLSDVSFGLAAGQTLALLGESGSGKSVSALAAMGLLPHAGRVDGGSIKLEGIDVLTLRKRDRRALLGEVMSMVFQDSLSAFNPVLTVGSQIAEVLVARRGMKRAQARAAAIALMDRVSIPDPASRYQQFPHQFSGGMRQRAMIAMAIALEPKVLIADEPTTALDVTVQAQIMALLKELQSDSGMAMVLITHDLGVAAEVADRVAVMYGGRIVEGGAAQDVLRNPSHPYTAGLVRSLPRLRSRAAELRPIPGSPPNAAEMPTGCAFHPRCDRAEPLCSTTRPASLVVAPGRESACHFPLGVGAS